MAMSCAAQAAQEDEQLWLQTAANVKLGAEWTLSDETNIRFSNARNGLYEIENNLLLNYKPSKQVTIAAGYTHDPQYAGGSFTVMERRAREQITFDNIAKIAGGVLSCVCAMSSAGATASPAPAGGFVPMRNIRSRSARTARRR